LRQGKNWKTRHSQIHASTKAGKLTDVNYRAKNRGDSTQSVNRIRNQSCVRKVGRRREPFEIKC